MLQKVGINITCQTLRENVQTIDLGTVDTTPNVYGKDMLVFAFNSSMWIVMIP
jgi:long-subunit acyl-CoA synthetase (AMP-forming)